MLLKLQCFSDSFLTIDEHCFSHILGYSWVVGSSAKKLISQMGLSEFRISKAKPGPKQYKPGDSGGLYLLIKPNGSKLWQQKIWLGGKDKILSQGKYPGVGLAKAREKRDKVRELFENGTDPARPPIGGGLTTWSAV